MLQPQTWAKAAPPFCKWEKVNSTSYRPIHSILIDGKILGPMMRRMIGEHFPKASRDHSAPAEIREKRIIPHSALFPLLG